MSDNRHLLLAVTLCGVTTLGACGSSEPATSNEQTDGDDLGFIARTVREALDDARRDIAEGNINLNSEGGAAPRAEITPEGDFLIDGRVVPVDDGQRSLLLTYRGHMVDLALAGAEMGTKGASHAASAVTEALEDALAGDAQAIDERVEAEADKIRASIVHLCDRMPDLLSSQQALKEALPAFAPYANLDQDDIDECYEEAENARASMTGRDEG